MAGPQTPSAGSSPSALRSATAETAGRKRRLLIVDARPDEAEAKARYLSAAGYEVLVATASTIETEEFGSAYDLAIIDADLPNESAIELCRELTSDGRITVILHSRSTETVERVAGLEAGAIIHLVEPFTNEVLEASVRSALWNRELGDRLELAVNISGLGHWEWDMATDSVSWTPSLEAMHGMEPGSFAGTLDAFLSTIHPDDLERVRSELEAAIGGSTLRFETAYVFVRTDGSTGHLLGRGRILRRRDGQAYELTGVAIDVTDRVAVAKRNDDMVAYAGSLMAAATLVEGQTIIRKDGPAVLGADVVDLEWHPNDDETGRADVEPQNLLLRAELRNGVEPGSASYHDLPIDLDGETIAATAVYQRETASGSGRIAVGWRHRPELDDDDRQFLELFAQQSISAARQLSDYERHLGIGLTLQRALAPRIDSAPGLTVASIYRPAGEASLIGGDWYDVIDVGSGIVGIVIGDVAGHGIAASASAAAFRQTVRTALAVHDDLADVLATVDRVMAAGPHHRCSTAALVIVDVETGDAKLLLAGHPPPVLRHGDGRTEVVAAAPQPLLGFDLWRGLTTTPHRFSLEPDDVLVLYTDGLVERRSAPLDAGLDALLGIVAATSDIDELVQRAADTSAEDSSLTDDTVVLALRPRH